MHVGYRGACSRWDWLESPFRPLTSSEEGTLQDGSIEGRKMDGARVQTKRRKERLMWEVRPLLIRSIMQICAISFLFFPLYLIIKLLVSSCVSEILTRRFELQDEDLHTRLCYFMWGFFCFSLCWHFLFLSGVLPLASYSFVPASWPIRHQERVDEIVRSKNRKRGEGVGREGRCAIRCPHRLNTVICHEAESLRKD